VFTTPLEYCEHIRGRQDGAVRWLHDLTAVAGGAVLVPAGTGTVFPGKEGLTVISHNKELEMQAALNVEAEWWRKHWDKESSIPESAFADKKNRKYPFKNPDGSVNKDGWMAAWRYPHKYSATGVINTLKRNLPKGYRLQEGSVVTASGGDNMKILCPECGHEHEVTTEAERLQADLDERLKELQELQSNLATAQGEKEALGAQLGTEKTVIDRFVEMAVKAGIEVAKEALPSLRKVDDEVFQTLLVMASREPKQEEPPEEPPATEPPEPVVASGGVQQPPAVEDTWNVDF